MPNQILTFDDVVGTDTIPAFVGLVSIQPDGNYVMNFGNDFVGFHYDGESQAVKFDTPRDFYSPYAPDLARVEVVGELRTADYTEPEPDTILFGYTKPCVDEITFNYLGDHYPSMECQFVTYNNINYQLYGEIEWAKPVLPITPVDYVRINHYETPRFIQAGIFAGTIIHGFMVDDRFGDETQLEGPLPDDFGDYLECDTCHDYNQHQFCS